MKPVKNYNTTPQCVGDLIRPVYAWHSRRNLTYKIVALQPCTSGMSVPCRGCDSGNVAYVVKRFNKREGNVSMVVCPGRFGIAEFRKVEVPRESR